MNLRPKHSKTMSSSILRDTREGCEGWFLRRSYLVNEIIQEEDIPLDATTEQRAAKEAAEWLEVPLETIQIGGDYP